eukprot:1157658-Pelagomonas_calceolata.AAC.2
MDGAGQGLCEQDGLETGGRACRRLTQGRVRGKRMLRPIAHISHTADMHYSYSKQSKCSP